MMPQNVMVVDGWQGHYVEETHIEAEVLGPEVNVSLVRVDDPGELEGNIDEADVVISWHTVPLTAQTLSKLKHCAGIVRAAVGFDNIDIRYAAKRGIPVCNVPDYGTEEVADHTIALILGGVRQLKNLDQHVRNGGWDWRAIGAPPRLRGITLGIVGFGRIGMAVARRAQVFGIDVGFFDPYVPHGIDKSTGTRRFNSLESLISTCEIISLHVPLSEETRHMIGPKQFDLMRGAILVNTARGPLIDQNALVMALESSSLDLVALDVLEREPEIPVELLNSSKSVLTPHAAFFSQAVLPELRQKAAQAAYRLLRNEAEPNIVNGVLTGRSGQYVKSGQSE